MEGMISFMFGERGADRYFSKALDLYESQAPVWLYEAIMLGSINFRYAASNGELKEKSAYYEHAFLYDNNLPTALCEYMISLFFQAVTMKLQRQFTIKL
jgi:hypothetical protein